MAIVGNGTEYATIASDISTISPHRCARMAGTVFQNSDLKWETVTTKRYRIDMACLKHRVSLPLIYFSKRYGDIITHGLSYLRRIVSDAYYENPITQPVNSAT